MIAPKPAYLDDRFAAAFTDPSVVARYPLRPPYPAALFDKLVELIADPRRVVLDVGAGTGDVARRLAPLVTRVDAVDVSVAMLALGRTLPGGTDPRLRWIESRVEDAPLDPPYSLITAGESLHWFDWPVALPRFAALLVPGGQLAIVGRDLAPQPWTEAVRAVIRRYSLNPLYQSYDLIAELTQRGLFAQDGEWRSPPIPFAQSLDDYIEALHSHSSLSRDRMTAAAASAFDAEVRAIVAPHYPDEIVQTAAVSRLVWGRPLAGAVA